MPKSPTYLSQDQAKLIQKVAQLAAAKIPPEEMKYIYEETFVEEINKIKNSNLTQEEKMKQFADLQRKKEKYGDIVQKIFGSIPVAHKDRDTFYSLVTRMQGLTISDYIGLDTKKETNGKIDFLAEERTDWLLEVPKTLASMSRVQKIDCSWSRNEDCIAISDVQGGSKLGSASRDTIKRGVRTINQLGKAIKDEAKIANWTYNPLIKKIPVTTWADSGIEPNFHSTLENPRWVQIGTPNQKNFWKTGLPGGKVDIKYLGLKFPFINVKYTKPTNVDYKNHISDTIDKSRLRRPPNLIDKFKPGQRQIIPENKTRNK